MIDSNTPKESRKTARFFLLLSLSIFISPLQDAHAVDTPSMRDFRSQNSNLSSREARQLYRDTYRRGAVSVPGIKLPPEYISTTKPGDTNPGGVIVNPIPIPKGEFPEHLQTSNHTLQRNDKQRLVRLNSGVDLDLTSTNKNIVLGENLFKGSPSVEISVGGETKTLGAGSQVTAAEYIAVKQALGGAGQHLSVSANGTANGGSVDLTQITANNDHLRASNLTVASGVTTYGDFGKRSDFDLLGNLNNFGSVVALSTSDSVKGGTIRAEDITNQQGASISSHVPSELSADSSLQSSVDLELNARGMLSNAGTISSSGNLTLTAATEIKNSGNVAANQSVNLNASKITNNGRVESLGGSVNIDGPQDAALSVDNTNGVIAAHNAINVRTPDFSSAFDNTVNGGDLLSQQLNLHAGAGTNYVNVNQLTGTITQTGLAGHVISSTDVLNIGETCLTGDPTFFNTAGDISITGNISVAEALTIVATGNIFSASGTSIDARDSNTGYDITMIAGANITGSTGSNSPTLPGGTAGSVTINGSASATGGSIALQSTITTTPTGTNGAGGGVSLFAFAGATPVTGLIDVDLSSIDTGGVGSGTNGNVLMVGGGVNGPLGSAIQTGSINTTGGTGGGGNLTVITSQPQSSGGAITYNANGTRTTAAQLVAGPTLTAGADIGMIGSTVALVAGDVLMRAGEDIGQAGGAVLFTNTFNANVVLEANQNIGAGFFDPLDINGFNTLFTKKVLKTTDPGNSTLKATSTNGSVYIQRNATTRLNLLDSSAKNDFKVNTGGELNINGNINSVSGSIQLENLGGNLNIAANKQITAFNFIEVTNGSTKKVKPTFSIGQNVLLQTSTTVAQQGSISLALDPGILVTSNSFNLADARNQRNIPPPHYAGSGLKPIVVTSSFLVSNQLNGGTVNFFGKEPLFQGPVNTINAKQNPVNISNYKKETLVFSGGISINAGQ
ncbi:MAG: hypothetical protein K2X93_04160 [Candidatus Obscuribacterales bacterium]|nr:hypothetical protein [Candidatus Obscuribacterales bacterium]